VARRRQPPISPVVVLTVLALIPAILLWSTWRWADGRAAGAEDAVPPAAETPVALPEPAKALPTTLLSFRRAAGELSRQLNTAAFETAVQPLLQLVDARSCTAISLDGRLVGARNPDTVVIPASTLKILVAAAGV
jgi:D-alanyl-D-alanine carboxypeptidase/D-alanyl-D-alanine-endopeptidase (penicillin-binding protein 4)